MGSSKPVARGSNQDCEIRCSTPRQFSASGGGVLAQAQPAADTTEDAPPAIQSNGESAQRLHASAVRGIARRVVQLVGVGAKDALEELGVGGFEGELPAGERGAITIYGKDPRAHELFAEHVGGSETWTATYGQGRSVREWRLRASRPDNHWLDCLVGCAAAAYNRG